MALTVPISVEQCPQDIHCGMEISYMSLKGNPASITGHLLGESSTAGHCWILLTKVQQGQAFIFSAGQTIVWFETLLQWFETP